ncbi:hypothetical protein NBRC111894_444 [Sporolactobacillus inulinus]|uniref:Uncharacterized protein n=1 Tax=Sporolactobacillus inulinus TaxID=2078 RepID=A0A4Y1Z7A0_9BACL|nr:hypothetical protein NBRC111894_444 [Sporolactobacillus inulinus]
MHLRFDSWPRHWSIGLKTRQNHNLLSAKKTDAAAHLLHDRFVSHYLS